MQLQISSSFLLHFLTLASCPWPYQVVSGQRQALVEMQNKCGMCEEQGAMCQGLPIEGCTPTDWELKTTPDEDMRVSYLLPDCQHQDWTALEWDSMGQRTYLPVYTNTSCGATLVCSEYHVRIVCCCSGVLSNYTTVTLSDTCSYHYVYNQHIPHMFENLSHVNTI